jgi:hypothetical protein
MVFGIEGWDLLFLAYFALSLATRFLRNYWCLHSLLEGFTSVGFRCIYTLVYRCLSTKHVLPLFRVLACDVFCCVSYCIRVRVKTRGILDHTTSIHHYDNFYLSYGNRVIDLYYLNVG